MGYSELIQKIEALPQEKRAVVFDFVDFLSARCSPQGKISSTEWTDVEFSSLSMHRALRGMKDDPVNYTRDDLREVWK